VSALVGNLTIVSLPPDFQPGGFSCGHTRVDKYLAKYAANDELAGVTRTYLVKNGDEMVAFVSVLCDAIWLEEQERPSDEQGAPALKIGVMGVRKDLRGTKYEGRTIGEWLIDWVVGMARSIAKMAGLRYVTLDALPENTLVDWYARNGFKTNEGEVRKRKVWKQSQTENTRKKSVEETDIHQVPMRLDILTQPEH